MSELTRKSRNSLRKPSGRLVEVDDFPILVAVEMPLVGVGAHLGEQLVPFVAHAVDAHAVELVEVGRVEARAQHRVLLRRARRVVGTTDGFDGHSLLPDEKLTS